MKSRIMRLAAFVLAIALLPLYGAAAETQAPAEHTVEKRTYPHLWHYDQYEEDGVNEGEINLYFVDGGDIPYTALSEYLPFLAKIISEAEFDGEAEVAYEIQSEPAAGFFLVTRPDNGSALLIDTEKDTMTFSSYDSFAQRPGSSRLVSFKEIPDPDLSQDMSAYIDLVMEAMKNGVTDEEGLNAYLAEHGVQKAEQSRTFFAAADEIYNRRGTPFTIPLADYQIDLICADGECYLPFQTMNDFLVSSHYVLYVFNGKTVIGDVSGGNLLDRAYEAEPEEMSEAFARYNFNELCLYLDYFYGLKEEHRIGSFRDYIANDTGLYAKMVSTSGADFDSAVTDLTWLFFDDGHSGFRKSSWRNEDAMRGIDFVTSMGRMGFSVRNKIRSTNALTDARQAAYPDGIPGYEEVGDTAFITFDSFSAKRRAGEYYSIEDPDNPQDTIELICYAHRQITREGSPVKNVVLDLSCNTGGSSDAALTVAAWFTGCATFVLRSTMTGAETIASYRADVNLNGYITSDPEGNGNRDPDDSLYGRYHLYCLISGKSFSCANLVPAVFEQNGGITLIGQRSGGGSNAVLPSTSASGTCFQVSGPMQISADINGSFYNVDTGVAPHVVLTKPESFYDREGLAEMIHNLK